MFVEKHAKGLNPGGFHRLCYSEFPGDPRRTVICVHGLSRNGRDFDWLAQVLASQGCRVICPDMIGRGRSEWVPNPEWYNYGQYMADLTVILGQLGGIEQVDWIGTSMGGLLGMMMAAMPHSPVKRLIINDVGPFIPAEALQHIKQYVSINPYYSDWDGFFSAFKKRMQPFGLQTEAEWNHLAQVSYEQDEKGRYRMNYDPRIISGLANEGAPGDLDLWHVWQQVTQPVLILRGADSNVLSPETASRMMEGKKASLVTFPNVGHAPALMSSDQIKVIKNWLSEPDVA